MPEQNRILCRELSLLAFNRRVLAQAQDTKVPLLERLRFLCIVSSNLDEFFEVRMAWLKRENKLRPHQPLDNGKTAASFAGTGGFDGGIERQQIGLVGNVVDQRNDLVDLHRAGMQFGDSRREMLDVLIGRPHRRGDGFHLLQRALCEIEVVQC